ncbi:hypothetical protein GCM10027605_30850 [Micromonospora zhanjiangensis]
MKFYLRERLLPPGIRTARNQARYDERHYRRLRLIRALTTVGGLDISAVRSLLEVIDDPDVTLSSVYHGIERAKISGGPDDAGFDGMENARADIDALADRLGWSEDPTRPGRESMAQVLAALRTLGCGTDVEVFLPFARAAEAVVDTEMDLLHTGGPTSARRR